MVPCRLPAERIRMTTEPSTAIEQLRAGAGSVLGGATEWVLLTGPRSVVTLGIALLIGGSLGVLYPLGMAPFEDVQTLSLVYNGLVVGNITLITVVVSINQLLVSRELRTPGELESQIADVIDYRSEVESATDDVAPVRPRGFLRLLADRPGPRPSGLADSPGVTNGRPTSRGSTGSSRRSPDRWIRSTACSPTPGRGPSTWFR